MIALEVFHGGDFSLLAPDVPSAFLWYLKTTSCIDLADGGRSTRGKSHISYDAKPADPTLIPTSVTTVTHER